MFEITSDDIAQLSDENLRALVGRLCEAELRKHGLPTSAVTWGGHQDARDGGVDVRVELPPATSISGFVPRPATVFQTKKESMPRTKILNEMRPEGVLRPIFHEMAERGGAYIVVSSEDSTSNTALTNRREAMAEAIQDLAHADAIALDFYDRSRLATWVRDHSGLILWVREKIQKQIPGWRCYGAWAGSPEGADDEYLLDQGLRIQTDTETKVDGLQALEGINRIRDRLHRPRSVVRLVGLSGVGKTRLVQALFDDRVGQTGLDPTLAYYTDISDDPDPPPTAVASNLITAHERAILVVDNCKPEMHRRLSELCQAPESLVSVITVEYDIREDQPEGTDVFSLEPSSANLIAKLIRRRFPHVSLVDVRTVAEFSGGNARIAIALAETIEKHETIAGLSDDDLFIRLFHQRHAPSESLLATAEALSLVYSFQGEETESDQAELYRLGALIGKSAEEMFPGVAELRRRQLVQHRSVWRAVLPQAIANRLAARALENIPFAKIEALLVNNAPDRLVRSFSRRLGYLHGSGEAKSIVERWLGPGGKLRNVEDFDELSAAMFTNVAPVAPEVALAALERTLSQPLNDEVVQKCRRYIPLIRSIAYEEALFERCIKLIITFAKADSSTENGSSGRQVFASLFPIYLSGTHATIEQRLSIIKSLLARSDASERSLGLTALKAILEATHYSAVQNFEFGARSRDYGYGPRSRGEIKRWFTLAIALAEDVACSDEPAAPDVRATIAEQFRGLWTSAAMDEELDRACRAISRKVFWTEGWVAVRHTMHFDSRGMPIEVSQKLAALESLLRPMDLVQKVRSIVFSNRMVGIGLDADDDDRRDIQRTIERAEKMAKELGMAAAVDQQAFAELLPECVSREGDLLWDFGRGLAGRTEQTRTLWNRLTAQLGATDERNRNVRVVLGFLNGLNTIDADLATVLLDEAVENEVLGLYYPVLQAVVGIDATGINRLMRSLAVGLAPIRAYRHLSAGRSSDLTPWPAFRTLVMEIAKKPGGLDVAIEIVYMRLIWCEGQNKNCDIDTIEAGRELLSQVQFTKTYEDYRLAIVSRYCLAGPEGAKIVDKLCGRLTDAVSEFKTYVFHQQDLLRNLFRAHPIAALDGLCGAKPEVGFEILDETNCLRILPFDSISESDLLGWCDVEPKTRYQGVAGTISPIESSDTGQPRWSGFALRLLERSPDRIEVLKKLARQNSSVRWTVLSASSRESDSTLLEALASHADPVVREFVVEEKLRRAEIARAAREADRIVQREIDERFE